MQFTSSGQKSHMVAVALQCLPLLFVGGCLAATFGPESWYTAHPGDSIIFFIGLTAFLWGAGYLYLGDRTRFGWAIASGVILCVLAWWMNLVLLLGCIDLGTSLNCPARVRVFDRPLALATAAVFAVWVAVFARDALLIGRADTHGTATGAISARSYALRIGVMAVILSLAVFGFYLSPQCTQLWNGIR